MSNNSHNDPIEWIEEAIAKEYFKYYEYKHFDNVEVIGKGGFGKVYRANWKNSEQYFALKSFSEFNNATAEGIVREVINDLILFIQTVIFSINNLFQKFGFI